MASTSNTRIVKTVGSPSVDGASGIETLASHTNNPSAHPDYLKKGALPAFFTGSDHLNDKLAHAVYFARRTELILTKMDYEQTKTMSLVNNSSNYLSTSGTKRYIVTSYVLDQILQDYGLTPGGSYVRTADVVKTTSVFPTTNLDAYVPSYALLRPVKLQVDAWLSPTTGIAATYLTKVDARATYVDYDTFNAHNHDVMKLYGMPEVLNYFVTEDTLYDASKTYFAYDYATHKMKELVVDVDYIAGDPIPTAAGNRVFECLFDEFNSIWAKINDVINLDTRVTNLEATTGNISGVIGYTLTRDTTPQRGAVYYRYDTTSKAMIEIEAADLEDTCIPVDEGLYCKIRNYPDTEDEVDKACASAGYVLTLDEDWRTGITYYEYFKRTPSDPADSTGMRVKAKVDGQTPKGLGLYVQVNSFPEAQRKELLAKMGFALTTDTTAVSGIEYYKYDSATAQMIKYATAPSRPAEVNAWVKVKNFVPDSITADLEAKIGFALTSDTTPVTGITYYKYDSATHTMIAQTTAPSNPAGQEMWVKVKNVAPSSSTEVDLTILKNKIGYVLTTDTAPVAGITYYQFTSSNTMVAYSTAPTKPKEVNAWVQSTNHAAYDDTELRVKSEYVKTTDTTRITGVTYYTYDSTTKSMVETSNANPASVNAWVKIRNLAPVEATGYDDTELKAKAPYSQCEETSPISGVQYYGYNAATKKMVPITAPSNPATAGAWVKVDNSLATASIEENYPEATDTKTLTFTRQSKSNIWQTTIPANSEGKSSTGELHVSMIFKGMPTKSFVALETTSFCGPNWYPLAYYPCVHTYVNGSLTAGIPINYSGKTKTGLSVRLRLCDLTSKDTLAYKSTYIPDDYYPNLNMFIPDSAGL